MQDAVHAAAILCGDPSHPLQLAPSLEVRPRPAAVLLLAVLDVLAVLRKVGVEAHPRVAAC